MCVCVCVSVCVCLCVLFPNFQQESGGNGYKIRKMQTLSLNMMLFSTY